MHYWIGEMAVHLVIIPLFAQLVCQTLVSGGKDDDRRTIWVAIKTDANRVSIDSSYIYVLTKDRKSIELTKYLASYLS